MNRGGKFLHHNSKFLRPGPAAYSDGSSSDDDSDANEDAEEEETKMPPPPSKKSSNANLSSSDEGSDADEEEDDDDEPEPSSKRSRSDGDKDPSTTKSKRPKPSFFDEEAEASDDDEGEEEEYGTHHDPHDKVKKHYTDDDIRRENMDREAMEIIERQNRRRNHLSTFTTDDSAEDIARQIEMRHRLNSRRVDRTVLDDASIVDGNQNLSAVTQQSLLPSVSDPSLWMFNCPAKKEQEMVYQIMNKCIAYARQGKPLAITSAIAGQSKGRVYIESYSEPAVREAVQGINGLMAYSMRLVPINDMTTVMTVTAKKKPVKKNEWVRMSRGHFKGDLALVRAVRESGIKCIVQCVPRLDLTLADLPPEEAKIRRRTVKPPQKFFNASEISALGRHNATRQRFPGMSDLYCDFFEGNYYHDGYLLKEVKIGTGCKPCSEDEPPTLDELQRFRNRNKANDRYDGGDGDDENEGSKMAKSLLDELSDLQGKTSLGAQSTNAGGLVIGDTVEIIEGDLVGMRGKLMSIDGSTVKVKPVDTNDLGETTEVEFLSNQVRKHIPVGAHVKVIEGRYANDTGVVVAVDTLEGETDATAVILTDMTNKEVSVRISQLQESAEVASGQDKLAGYELHDLVVLSGGGSTNEVGVIVRVGREEFTVINNHGISREVRPEELRGKRNSSSGRAVALDVQGNQIRVGDTVTVAEGPHKGKNATIKRMNRAQLFLYSQTRTENAGIFVVRSRSCVLSGNKVQSGPSENGQNPFSTPQQGGAANGRGRGRQDDGLIGKTVRIQAGNWKGYLGGVSDATPTHVQVELHSRQKKVMVLREKVAVAGDKFGATEDPNRAVNNMLAPTTPFMGGATPMHGGATPMHGGATPMHGSATPMHGESMGGGFTPSHNGGGDDVWRPGGSIDRPEDDMDNSNDVGSTWAPTTNDSNQDNGFSASSSGNDGGWGASNEQSGSTWTPSTNENGNSNESTTQMKIPKEEPGYGISGASTMGAADDGQQAPVWFMERVCIQLKRSEKTAVIKDITHNNAVVELEDKTSQTVSFGDCTMVSPKEHDTVLVTGGADVGVEGELVCIDGTDAILRDPNGDFKIVDLVHLAKIVSES